MTAFWITLVLIIGFVGATYAQSKRNILQTKVVMKINAPIDTAFNYIVPVDLSHIFKRYKSIAGITNTSIKEGWTKPGLIRTVYFEDGSTSKETLLTVVPHTSFSYKIEDFTSGLRLLAKRIEGNWVFTDLDSGQTKIEWTYKVVPKNFIAKGIAKIFLMKDITGLLNKALITLKDDLENRRYQNACR